MEFVQKQQIISTFITDQIQLKLTTNFSNKLKKPCFWPIFPILGAKKNYPKIQHRHAQLHMVF